MRAPIKLALLGIVFSACALVAFGQSRSDLAAIRKFITSQEAKNNESANEDYGKLLKGDLNHDGIPDVAVLYTMEINTTNNYVHYLAVFVRLKGRLVHAADTVVGGKHYRAIDVNSIRNNVIYCNTTDYADNDPTCCPTIKGSTKYVLKGNKLNELRSNARRRR